MASASIFLPAAGIGRGNSLNDVGSDGYYWSSVPSSDTYWSYAWHLYFSSSGHLTDDDVRRYNGLSVRPVQGFTKKRTK